MDTPNVRIERVVVGGLENNAWLIISSGTVLVVDAPFDAAVLESEIRGYQPIGIAITHGHFDHINAAPDLKSRLGEIPIYLHPDDLFLWQEQHPGTVYDQSVSDSQTMRVGGVDIQVLHTPGHTPGSVCYYLPELDTVFTGDTLFPGGPGATRWGYSDFDQIIESIRGKLFTLPEETHVLPGHGPATTVGEEKPKLQEWIQRGW